MYQLPKTQISDGSMLKNMPTLGDKVGNESQSFSVMGVRNGSARGRIISARDSVGRKGKRDGGGPLPT